jgi:hypothetical protein
MLPRARRLAQLGVQPGKGLPPNLPAYQVMTTEIDPGDEEIPLALVRVAGE